MRSLRAPLGIRATATTTFAVLALVVSAALAGGTYLTARHFLVEQRQATAARQAFVDAAFVRDGLLTSGSEVSEVLDSTSPPPGAVIIVNRGGRWYSSSLDDGADSVPARVRRLVDDGSAARAWASVGPQPVLAVGVPIPSVGATFYELSPTTELDSTLHTLGLVLATFALLTTIGGAVIGRSASARVVAPLEDVASATARIAAGEMTTRLEPTSDPDLAVIVGSFNTMVEALDERIQRDARFAADVAHELRSPVTTLMTSLSLLRSADDRAAGRRQAALDLVEREVRRLHRSLEHLLALGRLDATAAAASTECVDVVDLVEHALVDSHRPRGLATCDGGPTVVSADKQVLHRALVNLFDNADLHGGGLRKVVVRHRGAGVEVRVVDEGPGVPPEERERIFERFVRIGSRASRPGTGLGLSLVAETVRAGGGRVWCEQTPGGGATFVLSLPVAHAEEVLQA